MLNKLDTRMLPHRRRQPPVKRQKPRAQHTSQRHISRVIDRKIMPQRPDRLEKFDMRIFRQLHIRQILQPRQSAVLADLAPCGDAAQNVRNLKIQKMRRVKRFTSGE